jgi:tetratricopeptide (TPR) repeat protein
MISTARLRGRKLFVWGRGEGGRRWQEWLSPDGGRYAEIQAGLAQTQFQHLRMPAGADWTWVEAYGNAAVDPAVAHGDDWSEAIRHAEDRVAALLPPEALEDALAAAVAAADVPPAHVLRRGSGWGAVEAALRKRTGAPWIDEAGTPFAADTIGPLERPWHDLVTGGTFPGSESSVRGAQWDALLAAQPPSGGTFLHRATLAHAAGDLNRAHSLYEESLRRGDAALARLGLAHRGLALLALAAGDAPGGCAAYRSACAFLAEGDAAGALEILGEADAAETEPGRLRFLRAVALARAGSPDAAAALLREGIEVPDLREGENSISALWREVCPGEPVPARYQFSMG